LNWHDLCTQAISPLQKSKILVQQSSINRSSKRLTIDEQGMPIAEGKCRLQKEIHFFTSKIKNPCSATVNQSTERQLIIRATT
jgi:hypothetical protein